MVEGLCVGEAILGETDRCGCGEGCGIAGVVGARRRGINRQDSYVCIWSKTRKSQSDSMSIYRMGTRRSYGWLSSLLQNGQKREREDHSLPSKMWRSGIRNCIGCAVGAGWTVQVVEGDMEEDLAKGRPVDRWPGES